MVGTGRQHAAPPPPPAHRPCCQTWCRCPFPPQLWFARVLRDGFAAQLAGAPVTFRQLAGLHLDSLLAAHPASPHKQRCVRAVACGPKEWDAAPLGAGSGLSPAHVPASLPRRLAGEQALQSVLAAWAAADVYPDAPLAFRALHSAGLRLAVLTNGSGAAGCEICCRRAACAATHAASPPRLPAPAADAIVRPVLQKAGVEGLFSALLDVGMTGAWKPSPGSYAFAERHLGLPAEQARRRAALVCGDASSSAA